MALITLKTIQEKHLQSSRGYIMGLIRDSKFPKPALLRGSGGNLWDEAEVIQSIEKLKIDSAAANRDVADKMSARARRLFEKRSKKKVGGTEAAA